MHIKLFIIFSYDEIYRHDIANRSRDGDFKQAVAQKLIGATALTRYNNKTYRIDDIDWNASPMSTFECQGRDVTYKEYYE